MKKEPMAKGRRQEMKIPLSTTTIERWSRLWGENDYPEIAKMITPPTTSVNVASYLKRALADSKTQIPLSIAKAITQYYAKKQREVDSLKKIEAS